MAMAAIAMAIVFSLLPAVLDFYYEGRLSDKGRCGDVSKAMYSGATEFMDYLWTMVHGPWTMDYGPWTMGHGSWTMDHGPFGPWSITMDHGP